MTNEAPPRSPTRKMAPIRFSLWSVLPVSAPNDLPRNELSRPAARPLRRRRRVWTNRDRRIRRSCTGISSISSTPTCRSSNRSTCGRAAVTSFSTSIGEKRQQPAILASACKTLGCAGRAGRDVRVLRRRAGKGRGGRPRRDATRAESGHDRWTSLTRPRAGLACRIEHAAPPLPQFALGAQAVDPSRRGARIRSYLHLDPKGA